MRRRAPFVYMLPWNHPDAVPPDDIPCRECELRGADPDCDSCKGTGFVPYDHYAEQIGDED